MQGETRVSPVLISSHKISKKPYVQSLQKKLGVNQNSVAIGLLDPANRLFPDQSKEFLQDAERAIETAMGKKISILTPLINFSKTDVLVMASERGIDQTYSCHSGTNEPCGVCIACLEIINAKGEK